MKWKQAGNGTFDLLWLYSYMHRVSEKPGVMLDSSTHKLCDFGQVILLVQGSVSFLFKIHLFVFE